MRTSTIAVVVNAPEEVKPDQTTGMLIHGLLTRGHRVVVGGVAGLEVDDTQQVFMRGVDAIQGQDVALTVSSLRAMSRRIDLTTVAGVWLRTNPGRDLQVVINHRQIGQILDHSEASDLETWQDLLYLVQNGYLSVT